MSSNLYPCFYAIAADSALDSASAEWFDAEISAEQLRDQLDNEFPDGWKVVGYDDMPDLGECPDLGALTSTAETAAKLGQAYLIFCEYGGSESAVPSEEDFLTVYEGEFDSDTDFACYRVNSMDLLCDVSEDVAKYFDYEDFGRDLVLGGDYWTHDGHYFRNC